MLFRRSIRLTAFVTVTALLGACGTSTTQVRTPVAKPASQPVVSEIQPKPADAAKPQADSSVTRPPPQPSPPEVAVAPPRVDLPEPEQLIGLSLGKIEGLLGTPVFRRRDPPAELWQYSSPRCFFDLFLYRTKASPEYRVTHIEARGRTIDKIPLRECFMSLDIPAKG